MICEEKKDHFCVPVMKLMTPIVASGIQSEPTISQLVSCDTMLTGRKEMLILRHTHKPITHTTSLVWASETTADKQFIIKLALLSFLILSSITHCIPNVWSSHINISWSPSLSLHWTAWQSSDSVMQNELMIIYKRRILHILAYNQTSR